MEGRLWCGRWLPGEFGAGLAEGACRGLKGRFAVLESRVAVITVTGGSWGGL